MLLQRSGFKETLKYRPFGFSNETFSTTSLNTLLVLAVAVSCSCCALVTLLTWQLYMLVNTITSHLSCTQNFLFFLTEIYYQHTRLSNDRYSGLSPHIAHLWGFLTNALDFAVSKCIPHNQPCSIFVFFLVTSLVYEFMLLHHFYDFTCCIIEHI